MAFAAHGHQVVHVVASPMFESDFVIDLEPGIQLLPTIPALPILARGDEFLLGFAHGPLRLSRGRRIRGSRARRQDAAFGIARHLHHGLLGRHAVPRIRVFRREIQNGREHGFGVAVNGQVLDVLVRGLDHFGRIVGVLFDQPVQKQGADDDAAHVQILHVFRLFLQQELDVFAVGVDVPDGCCGQQKEDDFNTHCLLK